MKLDKGVRVSCPHSDGAKLGTIERVDTVIIRVKFDGESKIRLIKKKAGFYEIVPGQEGPVEKSSEEPNNTSKDDKDSEEQEEHIPSSE